MKELEERIKEQGTVLPGNVLKVGSFLNQQVDIKLLQNMAKETKKLFDCEITKVLTIEASGIAFATAIAIEYGVPLVVSKKSKSSNVSGEIVSAEVFSYTHNINNIIFIPKDYITRDDKVLIADDFLANGCALAGLIKIVEECGAKVVGAAIEIEKYFQGGGDKIREQGYRVESLAKIEEMNEKQIVFKK